MLQHDELLHYGVRGMRWGVRRSPEARLSKIDAKVSKIEGKMANLRTPSGRIKPGKADKYHAQDYRAEIYRRKGDKIRAKQFADVDKTKAITGYKSAIVKAQWRDDKFLASRINDIAGKTMIAGGIAIMLYPGPRTRQTAKDLAWVKLAANRNDRQKADAAFKVAKKLGSTSQGDLLKTAKAGVSYVIRDNGSLKRVGMAKAL